MSVGTRDDYQTGLQRKIGVQVVSETNKSKSCQMNDSPLKETVTKLSSLRSSNPDHL